jgi:hypothetical protein
MSERNIITGDAIRSFVELGVCDHAIGIDQRGLVGRFACPNPGHVGQAIDTRSDQCCPLAEYTNGQTIPGSLFAGQGHRQQQDESGHRA